MVTGEIYLLCKGAESAMLNRVVQGDKVAVLKHVDEFAVVSKTWFIKPFILYMLMKKIVHLIHSTVY